MERARKRVFAGLAALALAGGAVAALGPSASAGTPSCGVNTPDVLTAGSSAGDKLTTHALNLVAGTFNPAQMWATLIGAFPPS
jgi:hypothetical protein